MAYVLMAYIFMAYAVMAYVVMAYMVMAGIVMASIVMASDMFMATTRRISPPEQNEAGRALSELQSNRAIRSA